MNLYSLSANLSSTVFGDVMNNIPPIGVVNIIAQTPDCSSFLVLSDTAYPNLVAEPTIPSGYDFTYCQAWGLTINDEVIKRVKKDLRLKELSNLVVTTSLGNTYNADEQSQARISKSVSVLALDTDTKLWTLANNVPTTVTKSDLREALQLAVKAQDDLWLKYL